nr:MAG TPA: hypothetical protein [Bacteriophage sp.]
MWYSFIINMFIKGLHSCTWYLLQLELLFSNLS